MSNIITVPAEHQVLCTFPNDVMLLTYHCSSFKFHAKAMTALYCNGTYQSTMVLPSVTVLPRHQCWSKETSLIHITLSPSNKAHKHKYCLIPAQQPSEGQRLLKAHIPHCQITWTLINHLLEQIYTAVWIVLDDQMLICVHFKGWQCQKHLCLG